MCSRFALKSPPSTLAKLLHLEKALDWKPRYNLAPSQMIPAVVNPLENEKREMKLLRWGFVASWHQGGRLLINARSEDLADRPILKESFEKWRCLVPVDGFYEWRHEARESKPFYIRMKDGQPFALAGLWAPQTFHDQTAESCVLLTTSPNEVVRVVHERMPVIIAPEDFKLWLDSKDVRDFEKIQKLFKPFGADKMEAYEVDNWVNDPQHDDPRCLEPFQNPETLPLPF